MTRDEHMRAIRIVGSAKRGKRLGLLMLCCGPECAGAEMFATGLAAADVVTAADAHIQQTYGPATGDVEGPPWTHGTRLGRDHRSVRRHLVEDHGVHQDQVDAWLDGAVHGHHDAVHRRTWAYAEDLAHPAPGDQEYRRPIDAAAERYASNMLAAGYDVTVTRVEPGQVRVSGRAPGSDGS